MNNGFGAAQNTLAGNNALFSPYVSAGQGAQTTLADALGLNGQAGNAAATAAFQSGPGYQYQVQQALNGVLRNASATGALGSGNTLAALQNTGNNLANQNWQQ